MTWTLRKFLAMWCSVVCGGQPHCWSDLEPAPEVIQTVAVWHWKIQPADQVSRWFYQNLLQSHPRGSRKCDHQKWWCWCYNRSRARGSEVVVLSRAAAAEWWFSAEQPVAGPLCCCTSPSTLARNWFRLVARRLPGG